MFSIRLSSSSPCVQVKDEHLPTSDNFVVLSYFRNPDLGELVYSGILFLFSCLTLH